jgi:hypothetical protein
MKMAKWVPIAALLAALMAAGMAAPRALSAGEEMDLDKAIASAKTAADHEAIAKEYQRLADAAKAEATLHQDMEKTYEKTEGSWTKKLHLDSHCAKLSDLYKKIASENAALAKAHEEMAKAAK